MPSLKIFSLLALIATMGISCALVPARAAELVMFEQAGCVWCQVFDREVAPIYGKTDEGKRVPLRRIDIKSKLPADLAFIEVERLTPLFVLVDNGREIGRIRGYPGDDNFWGLFDALLKKIDRTGTRGERTGAGEKPLRANG